MDIETLKTGRGQKATLKEDPGPRLDSRIIVARGWHWIRGNFTPICISALLLAGCVFYSLKAAYSTDEILNWYPVADPSFSHMLAASKDVINTTPPLYFVIGWCWAKVFGTSDLSIRLLSPLGMCGAFWVMWRLLRPRYGFLPASLALCASYVAKPLLIQTIEARFYGFYLLTCALAVQQYARLRSKGEAAPIDYILNFVAHAAMIFTHSFGLLYSGCILVAWWIFQPGWKRKILFSASIISAWTLFAWLWLGALLHQMTAFRPYSYLPVPGVGQLLAAIFWCRAIAILALLVVGTLVLFHRYGLLSKNRDRLVSFLGWSLDAELELPLLGAAMITAPILLAWIISHVGTSCFADRYFLPSALAWAMILSYLGHKAMLSVSEWARTSPLYRAIWKRRWLLAGPGIALLCAGGLLVAKPVMRLYQTGRYIGPLTRQGSGERPGSAFEAFLRSKGIAEDVPVVCTYMHTYLPFFFYSPKPSRYYFALDFDYALSGNEKTNVKMVEYKNLEALKRHYSNENIFQWDDFLRQHDQFLVLQERNCRWAEYRLNPDSGFSRRLLSSDDSQLWRLFMVTRIKQ